jgi:hypothetical protein
MRRGNAPFKQPYWSGNNGGIKFKLKSIVQLFARVKVLSDDTTSSYVGIDKDLSEEYAAELANEVCDSNTAEKVAYTIQQLMFNEKDQNHRPEAIFNRHSISLNPDNRPFCDLEAWATQASDGTVTVDTYK